MQAELPASSTAVAVGAPVEYRNVTVGTVASQGRSAPGGFVVLTLHMQTQMLPEIPAQVRATETPVSFFGDPYVELISSSPPGSARLHAGEAIPALQTAQTGSLQTTLGSLDSLLINLHPAELDAALTALASSLQGNGTSLGHDLVRANTYFRQMLPLWPTVVSNLQTLVPVANQFAASTPDILQILANQTTTAKTITDQASGVRSAIGGGETLSGEAAQLLTAIQEPFNILTADSGPFLTAISQNPEEISQLLHGLYAWANVWISAESSGPYLELDPNGGRRQPGRPGLGRLGRSAGCCISLRRFGSRIRQSPDLLVRRADPHPHVPVGVLGADVRGRLGSQHGSGALGTGADPGGLGDRLGCQRFGSVLVLRLDVAALPGTRESGHPLMRTHHRRPGLPGTVVKVVVFIVVSAILTSIVISTLLDVNPEAATGYVAQFSNASGLQSGDTVRIAGVEVGKVGAVTLQDNHAEVSFSVDNSQHLTTTSLAAIHFENLLGQRFLAILPGARRGRPLPAGGVIPLAHTTPAIDLTAVFDGFQPLFAALSPNQVNELAGSIIDVFQNESGTVSNIVAETASLTQNLANRQQVIDTLLNSLSSLLNTVGVHDTQLGQLIGNFDTLMTGLAGSRAQLGSAIDSLSVAESTTSDLVNQAQPSLNQDIQGLSTAVQSLSANQQGLDGVLQGFPGLLNTLTKIQSSGNWINVYLCNLTINVSGQLDISLVPGVIPPINIPIR